MKKVLFTLLLCLGAALCLQAQSYTVLKVEPKDQVKANGKPLKVGDKITENTQITLSHETAFMRVMGSKSSYTVRKEGKIPGVFENSKDIKIAGTRTVISDEPSFKQFIITPKFLVIDELVQSVAKSIFPLEKWTEDPEGKFFFIEYTYQGEEILKFLPVADDNAFVINAEVYTIDGKAINPQEAKNLVFKYAIDESREKLIGKIDLVLLKGSDLKEEIGVFLKQIQNTENDKTLITKIIQKHLTDYYGEPDYDHLSQWLQKEFGF